MAIVKRKQGNNDRPPKVNLLIRVAGFADYGDDRALVGTDMRTGEQITAALTDKGYFAARQAGVGPGERPSIGILEKGYKSGRRQFALEEGGVVVLQNAFQNREGVYIGTWPNVVAYTPQDAKDWTVNAQHAMFTLNQRKNDGKFFGSADVYHEELITQGETPQDIYQDVLTHIESNYEPPADGFGGNISARFYSRYLDQQGNVMDLGPYPISAVWNQDQSRLMTPEESATAICAKIEEAMDRAGASGVSVVPITSFKLSSKALSDADEPKLNKFRRAAHAFYRDLEDDLGRDVYCRQALFKVGGDQRQFVNDVFPVEFDKNHPGVDPGLLGGLSYAPESGLDPSGIETKDHSAENAQKGEEQQTNAPKNQMAKLDEAMEGSGGYNTEATAAAKTEQDNGGFPDMPDFTPEEEYEMPGMS